jgi:hypothetical protein
MPSLRYTELRWLSTVLTEMNLFSAISDDVDPVEASADT